MLTRHFANMSLSRHSTIRPRAITVAALLSVLASPLGCGSAEPEVELRESEAVERQDGSSFNSAFADATKTYLSKRRIDTLINVGALEDASLTLANRVDGIIASQPANGYLSTAELLTMEHPDFIKYLHATEKAEMATLWGLLETTSATPTAFTLRPTQAADFKEAIVEPGTSLPDPGPYPIAQLPVDAWRAPAERLELGSDEDADPSTVSLADLLGAIAAPWAFLPEEITWFEQIRDYLLSMPQSPLQARLEVPDMEESVIHGNFAGGQLVEYRETAYRLRRDNGSGIPWGGGSFFDYSSKVGIRITAPVADSIVWICQSAVPSHQIRDEGLQMGNGTSQDLPITANGLCVLEHWSGGTRLGAHAIERVGATERAMGEDAFLREHAGFDLVTESGQEIDSRTFQPVDLSPGRYVYNNFAIDIFPQDAVRITDLTPQSSNAPVFLSADREYYNFSYENQWSQGGRTFWFKLNPGAKAVFTCLGLGDDRCTGLTRLTPSMRTG